MSDILRNFSQAFRSLRARPAFLAAAVATLAIGIGATTGVFSVVQAALLRPLPFEAPERLVVVWGVAGPERDIRGASPIEVEDWDRMVDALGPLSRYDETTVNLSGEGEAQQLEAEVVGPEFLRILGVAPALGRGFVADDDRPGAGLTAVLSHELWRTRFGGDASAVGRTVRLDGTEAVVIGVMPEGFRGLSFDTEVWVPLGPFLTPEGASARGGRWLAAIGRLAEGAGSVEAQAQLTAAASRLEELYPESNTDRGAMLLPLRDYYVAQSRPMLLMVMGAVLLLLLIACANVANLQIVRGLERTREIGLRYALGAGRGRLARQIVEESLVLGLLGGGAGVLVAAAAMGVLVPFIPPGILPAYATPALGWPVLGFALATALITATLFGLAPALRVSRQDPATALRGGGRGITAAASHRWADGGGPSKGRRGRPGAQQMVVISEVALALVLLVGAGLALRSLREQLSIRPGFTADGILAARVSLPSDFYDEAGRTAFLDRLLERTAASPGVLAAAAASDAPLRGYTSASILRLPEDQEREVRYYRHRVTPGFFQALEIPVRGRGFTTSDRADAPGVVVVSEALAARLWPEQEALGRRLMFGAADTATVIGVAANVRYRDLTTSLMDPGEDPDVYFPFAQRPVGSFDVLLKTTAAPAGLTAGLRREVTALDPAIPLYDVAPLASELAAQTGLGRMVSAFLTVFAALALLVAAVGLYGLLAFVVRGRQREIAIRQALGARPSDIRRMVTRQGLGLTAAGVGAGLVAALVAGRVAAAFLYGVRAVDPAVLALTAGALLAVAALASWLPARQATSIQPGTVMSE